MKYLSKHYRPAEKEFLNLAEGFRKMVKRDEDAKVALHPNVYALLEIINDLIEKVEGRVAGRIQRAEFKEQDEAKRRANRQADCPRCNEIVAVIVTGEIKVPKTGYTHYMVKCKVCKKEFTDYLPAGDEDLIKWYGNLIKELREVEPDGRTRWQHMGMTEQDMIDTVKKQTDLIEACRKEKEVYRSIAEMEAALYKVVEDIRDKLLLLRLDQQNWNGGGAKA